MASFSVYTCTSVTVTRRIFRVEIESESNDVGCKGVMDRLDDPEVLSEMVLAKQIGTGGLSSNKERTVYPALTNSILPM